MKLLLIVIAVACIGASFYVAPDGSGVVGSFESPMGLSNALKSGVSPAGAGDTIWLRGGTYTGQFTCNLSAPSNNPIVIRNYNRERATLTATSNDSAPLVVNSDGVWYWGLELCNSDADRYAVRNGIDLNSSFPGEANKLINCVVHDLGNAIFVSYQSTNAEVYGCVMYNNGYQLSDRGHGHNLYVQNRNYGSSQTKFFSENIGLNVFDVGVNVRSSFDTINMVLTGNVMVNSGSLSTNGYKANWHTEGETTDLITFNQNFNWYPSQTYGGTYWSLSTNSGTITMTSNVWVHTYSQLFHWTNVIFKYNIQSVSVDIRNAYTNFTAADFNTYYNNGTIPIFYNQTNYTLEEWRALFGNGSNSTATASGPTGTWTYVRPNAYELGRANIIVYNWDTNDNVNVDVSGVLQVGQPYQVRNAADYYGSLVASGIYGGGNITLPMTNLSVATPVGIEPPPATDARFNVFVLQAGVSSSIRSATVNNWYQN